MKFRHGPVLGLAIDDRAVFCAQVASGGAKASVQHLGRFDASATSLLERPAEFGQQLLAFLRSHRFGATRAVVGVPARWLIAQERDVPPADPEQVRSLLQLQAERLAVADGHELAFDYAGSSSASAASRVLLVGILRKRLDAVTEALDAAGLTVLGITSTSLVLARHLGDGRDAPVLVLGETASEMVLYRQGNPAVLRHLSASPAPREAATLATLASEVRRAVQMAQLPGDATRELLVWDAAGLSDPQLAEMSGRVGMHVRSSEARMTLRADVSPQALNGDAGTRSAESFLPAVSLAVAGAGRAALPLDLHLSKLTPPVKRRVNRTVLLGSLAAVALVGGLVAFWTHVTQREADLVVLEAQYKSMAEEVKAAGATIDRVNYGRGYFETRPRVLECLRELTAAYRDGDAIWTTGVTLRDNGRGQLQGKAADQGVVLAVLDRLKANPRFANVQLQEVRDAAGRSREVAFSIAFTYVAKD
jgi:hypothetical protein